jgi:hypothetical protein
MQPQAYLFHAVAALHAASGLARRLDGGEQQGDEDADDRNDDQQFNQRKTPLWIWGFGVADWRTERHTWSFRDLILQGRSGGPSSQGL